MEKVVVSYTESVQSFFDELIVQLFNKEYFSYEENAIHYVQKLAFYIENNIANLPPRKTPKSLSKYGDFYIFYKSKLEQLGIFSFLKRILII